jgi:penicillin-binding protein 1A
VSEPPVPEGIVRLNGEWYYDEFTGSASVRKLSEDSAKQSASAEEKKSILDLFKR